MGHRGYSVEGTENMGQKIGGFGTLKFQKSRVIYKGFLKQTQGTKKKFEKLGNSNNRMFEKSGFNCRPQIVQIHIWL